MPRPSNPVHGDIPGTRSDTEPSQLLRKPTRQPQGHHRRDLDTTIIVTRFPQGQAFSSTPLLERISSIRNYPFGEFPDLSFFSLQLMSDCEPDDPVDYY